MSPYVTAAIITAAPTAVSSAAAVLGVRLHRAMKTNHGKRPGEYLEQLDAKIDVVLDLLGEHIGDPDAHDHPQRLVVVDGTR